MQELSAPPDAATDPNATEVARIWLIGDALHCTLDPGLSDDPALWGGLLADLARHIAAALAEDAGRDPGETLAAIRNAFDEVIDAPPEGSA